MEIPFGFIDDPDYIEDGLNIVQLYGVITNPSGTATITSTKAPFHNFATSFDGGVSVVPQYYATYPHVYGAVSGSWDIPLNWNQQYIGGNGLGFKSYTIIFGLTQLTNTKNVTHFTLCKLQLMYLLTDVVTDASLIISQGNVLTVEGLTPNEPAYVFISKTSSLNATGTFRIMAPAMLLSEDITGTPFYGNLEFAGSGQVDNTFLLMAISGKMTIGANVSINSSIIYANWSTLVHTLFINYSHFRRMMVPANQDPNGRLLTTTIMKPDNTMCQAMLY